MHLSWHRRRDKSKQAFDSERSSIADERKQIDEQKKGIAVQKLALTIIHGLRLDPLVSVASSFENMLIVNPQSGHTVEITVGGNVITGKIVRDEARIA